MKICFPVEVNNGLDSDIYGHFGSAPGFVTFDTESEEAGYIDNKLAVHEHGACNPAGALENSGVSAVIVSGIGQGAIMRLVAGGLSVYKAKSGSVRGDIANFQTNNLTKLNKDMRMCASGHSCGH